MCLRNSKVFFGGVFLSNIYNSRLPKKLELSSLCRKKVTAL